MKICQALVQQQMSIQTVRQQPRSHVCNAAEERWPLKWQFLQVNMAVQSAQMEPWMFQ